MSQLSTKSKKARSKPSKSRPVAVSADTQPVVENTTSLFFLSSFSPRGDLFAYLSLAVDKHRLRIYDAITAQSVAEHTLESSRATSLCWVSSRSLDQEDGHRNKRKKRKHRPEPDEVSPPSQNICIGLENGSLLLFSPSQGRLLKTVSHSSSSSPILAIDFPTDTGTDGASVWTSSGDATIRVWNLNQSTISSTWKVDERIPYSALAVSPRATNDERDGSYLLAANYAIHLLSFPEPSSESTEREKPRKSVSFTGHASAVTHLRWDSPSRFLSSAENDRFLYLWDVPTPSVEGTPPEGKVVASIPLDSDVRAFSLALPPTPPFSSPSQSQSLLALSSSGKLSIFSLSNEAISQVSADGRPVVTLNPGSTITVSPSKTSDESRGSQIIAAIFVPSDEGKIRVARMVGGVKLSFDVVPYVDAAGALLSDIRLTPTPSGISLAGEADGIKGASNKRYAESASVAVRSGVELGQDAAMDDTQPADVDGALDVDMAELSLGQRLSALTGNPEGPVDDRSDSNDKEEPSASKDPGSKEVAAEPLLSTVPASSLTRTLIQALHSSDAGLLEACLTHTNAALIQNTVQRLPSQLAVPLIAACVERLGRGKGVGRGKGGGAAAGAQRATGLVRWIRTVLIVHGGHLLTMPDLVARLAGLHTTLASRLTLQDSLYSLSGRLDMVISQIELRSSAAPAPLPLPGKKRGKGKARQQKVKNAKPIRKYVEGESEDDEPEPTVMQVEVESADEAGSVEDVELGGSDEGDDNAESSEEEDEDEEEEDGEDEEDDVDDDDSDFGSGPKINGLIDDEAEEFSGEDDEDESD